VVTFVVEYISFTGNCCYVSDMLILGIHFSVMVLELTTHLSLILVKIYERFRYVIC
jgi:hypothetical protein